MNSMKILHISEQSPGDAWGLCKHHLSGECSLGTLGTPIATYLSCRNNNTDVQALCDVHHAQRMHIEA